MHSWSNRNGANEEQHLSQKSSPFFPIFYLPTHPPKSPQWVDGGLGGIGLSHILRPISFQSQKAFASITNDGYSVPSFFSSNQDQKISSVDDSPEHIDVKCALFSEAHETDKRNEMACWVRRFWCWSIFWSICIRLSITALLAKTKGTTDQFETMVMHKNFKFSS